MYTWQHPFASEETFRDTVNAYRAIGFTDLIFPMPPEAQWTVMERCARVVVPQLRQEASDA